MERWYNLDSNDTMTKLNTKKQGLTQEEAKSRLAQNGPNKLKSTKHKSVIVKFFEQFKDVMLIILIIAAIISFLVGDGYADSIIILVVVLLNAVLGTMQEEKAEKAIDALKKMSMPYIKVRRNSKVESVKTEELVVGDIVLIEAGDTVPADMRIIESHVLRVEEAALTGESMPVDKTDARIDGELALADRKNMLYSGSNVVYGRAEAVVTDTGINTELGKIAESLSTQKTDLTPLQKKINSLSKVLSIIVVVIAVVMFLIGLFRHNDVLEVLMLAISLAVAAIPEGLSAVITITLALGVQKMAKQNAIIRQLSSVEALGATEVICSDKTGTLTQNKMTIKKVYIEGEIFDLDTIESIISSNEKKVNEFDVDKVSHDFDILTKTLVFCNDSKFSEENGKKIPIGDPTETALVDFSNIFEVDKEVMDEKYPRVNELPFDSERKMMSVSNKLEDKYFVSTKGAVESVLEKCDTILINGKVEPLTNEKKDEILKHNTSMATQALRVLAFGYKEEATDKVEEENYTFVGMVGMIDPPRKEVIKAVERCKNAGIIPVMITGDNLETAVAIAKEVGIFEDGKKAVTSYDLDNMSDDELFDNVQDIAVYARMSPANKIRIVKAWKKHGKVVAMTGDGVNDAPALKAADIGVGMGITGTEVSKSVSSMVLADDNFATIVGAVKEGRRIYNNLQNVIAYLLASNLAEILIIFVSSLLGFTILKPLQILWINLVTDTIPAIALGLEKEEKGIMRQKPKHGTSIFTPFLVLRILIPAIIKTIVVFGVYFAANKTYSHDVAMGVSFITLSLMEILFAYICRSDKKSIASIGFLSNKPMCLCVVITTALQYIIICTPFLANLLGVANIPVSIHLALVALCVLVAVLFEAVKLILAKAFKLN